MAVLPLAGPVEVDGLPSAARVSAPPDEAAGLGALAGLASAGVVGVVGAIADGALTGVAVSVRGPSLRWQAPRAAAAAISRTKAAWRMANSRGRRRGAFRGSTGQPACRGPRRRGRTGAPSRAASGVLRHRDG